MKLTGTFLDEISHDIPHQNWGRREWERDFRTMRAIGIDTVILIRCGHRRWMTYPSQVLEREQRCHVPPVDLVRLFLDLAESHGMDFYFGGYDSGDYWHRGEYRKEVDLNLAVMDEAWARYGASPAFRGWYLTQEVARKTRSIIDIYRELGAHGKQLSGGLPVLISPYIEGMKDVSVQNAALRRDQPVGLDQHAKDWDEIFAGIRGAVDIVAFQDGHVDFHELPDFLAVNKALGAKYGLRAWTNSETFDRDMPIKFLPIKWEKLLLKLQAAGSAGIEKGITFEFSHFLSPHSCYAQAKGLFDRYCEHFGIEVPR